MLGMPWFVQIAAFARSLDPRGITAGIARRLKREASSPT
jgi:hypothetical protein